MTTVLFTGYAPVHFACFRPIYDRLLRIPGYQIFLSGGLRVRRGDEVEYDTFALYKDFGVPLAQILSVQAIERRDFDFLFAANTKMIRPRNARVRVQLFHGLSFRNRAIRAENLGCDAYFLVGPYMQRKFIAANLFAPGDPRALSIGFPKTDRLLNGELMREELLHRFGLEQQLPILLYAPTGERHNSLETMGEKIIYCLARERRYNLLVKLHDHPKDRSVDWMARISALEDRTTRLVRDPDVTPALYLADLLITDASSVSSEYALLDRPMIFLDVPELLARARLATNSMLDMETWGRRIGPVVSSPEDLAREVEASLGAPERFGALRRAMAKDLFFNPGRATDAALEWILGAKP